MTKVNLAVLGAVLVATLSFRRAQESAPLPVEIPIGGILLWWGAAKDIPPGFEACDGTVVKTKDAVLRGAKPNLESRFPRGAPAFRSFVPEAYVGGGSDTIVLDGNSLKVSIDAHKFTLKETQLPAHDHEFGPLEHTGLFNHSHPIAAHSHGMDHLHDVADHTHGGVPNATVAPVSGLEGTGTPFTASRVTAGADTSTDDVDVTPFRTTGAPLRPGTFKEMRETDAKALTTDSSGAITVGPHPEGKTERTGKDAPIELKHTLTVSSSFDNRPAYTEVVFLIRVK